VKKLYTAPLSWEFG